MAALNFPTNPAGQTPTNTFSPSSTPSATTNGATYVWNGSAWTGLVDLTEAMPLDISTLPTLP